jgi:hypothetical protein
MLVGWSLAKKGMKYGFVPTLYVAIISPSSTRTGSTGTQPSITRPQEAPKRLFKRNLLPIYDSNSNLKDMLVSSSAAEDAKSKMPRLKDFNLLGFEFGFETEKFDGLGGEHDPESATVRKMNNWFSWYSNESQQFITTVAPANLQNRERDNSPGDDFVPSKLSHSIFLGR